MKERTIKYFEISFCVMAFIILILFWIVVLLLEERINPYDVNRDGKVDYIDLIEEKKVLEKIENE